MKLLKSITVTIAMIAYAASSFAGATAPGQIVFFNKKIAYHKATTDKDNEILKDWELGDPLYASAIFDKSRTDACKECNSMNMRFSVDGISYSSTQMRADYNDIYSAAAGPTYYASATEAGIQMVSDKGWYFEMYDLTEDAFRMFLSKMNSKLKVGTTVPVKVELLATNDKEVDGTVLATGTLNVKVTDKVKNNANFLVRASAMMSDAAVEKAIADQYKVRITGTAKIYKVVLSSNYNYKRNSRTGINENKNIDAYVMYKTNDGACWVAKNNYIFEFEGNDFSKMAKMGKILFAAPVPGICYE
ncbi:MAG: hypothetical protein BGO69_08180 [Bacteroidetes bacterium 46-16]|nr:MAG: hypothetical protein BGO69_08180 [Bacteroidetes bacterium 46-16]